jgi:hypothetical protein
MSKSCKEKIIEKKCPPCPKGPPNTYSAKLDSFYFKPTNKSKVSEHSYRKQDECPPCPSHIYNNSSSIKDRSPPRTYNSTDKHRDGIDYENLKKI